MNEWINKMGDNHKIEYYWEVKINEVHGTWYNMHEAWKHTKWKKMDIKAQILYDFVNTKCS